MDSILLRIIIFVIFCLIGLGMINLVGSRSVSSKKEIIPSKFPSVKDEECQDNICPMPDSRDGNKNLKERR
jgi:hypothetical protein